MRLFSQLFLNRCVTTDTDSVTCDDLVRISFFVLESWIVTCVRRAYAWAEVGVNILALHTAVVAFSIVAENRPLFRCQLSLAHDKLSLVMFWMTSSDSVTIINRKIRIVWLFYCSIITYRIFS